jgi:cell division protein FtsB
VTASHRWEERRRLRRLERRRRRGGHQRGPVVVQRTARGLRGWIARNDQRLRRSIQGDRPLMVATLGVLALAVVILSTPMQSYLDGRARVDHLAEQAAALDGANAQLEQRAADLVTDDTIELLAREQLGLVRPGEVAYTLIPPEEGRPLIAPPRGPDATDARAWYRRMWDELLDRLGG